MNLPPYKKFPIIISNSIVLREVEIGEINELIEISYYDSRPALTVDDAVEMQQKINQDYLNGTSIHWAIADRQTNKIAGTVGYYRGFDKEIGELGCVLKADYRGLGLMTRAMKLAIEFGFNDIELTQIIAITSKQNHKAVKLLERLNFTKTADLPDDEIEFEILASS